MLFEDQTIRTQLERIIARMSDCDTWRDDLLQEGLIHLWRMEEQRPNQKLSWYLQGCLFHLRRFIAIGRSVDSWKRRQRVIPLPIDEQGDWEFLPPDYVDGEFISEIGAQEAIEYLCQWLTASEQEVLACLAEGLAPHEISQKLRISCKTILRYRRRIARLTLRLGLKD
jgi:DNA-directed RNA polymerase specialized sigma24 family protein